MTTLTPDRELLVLPVPGTSETFATRVFSYIDFSGDCWQWTGTTYKKGYGVIGKGVRGAGNIEAHRAVWRLLVGTIPDGLQLDHRCRNHGCVNPDHLEPVTSAVNKARGFSMARLHALRDACLYGHPKDGRLGGRGGRARHRYCKTCARQKASARYVPKGPAQFCRRMGHEFTPENTYIDPRGRRCCRACKISRQREARAAARQQITEECAA